MIEIENSVVLMIFIFLLVFFLISVVFSNFSLSILIFGQMSEFFLKNNISKAKNI
jgi:hypothetical protein